MHRKHLPLLRKFSKTPIIPRTPENDVSFAPLVEWGVIYPTLGHGWKLSEKGQMALEDDAVRAADGDRAV